MSCLNHRYDAYQKAADSLKNALVEALNSDEETSTLTELWEDYLRSRNRADKAVESSTSFFGDTTLNDASKSPVFDFSTTGDTFTISDLDGMNIAAAEVPHHVVGGSGEDVITFS
tara:strand:- start:13526 stop:13870 length:345 start_codon:yes stop_codon:yes gene_type:complete